MGLVAQVQAQLASVAAIAGRVHGAAKLAQLTEQGQLAQAGVAAFVVPLGLGGGAASDGSGGLYRQSIDRLVGVILAVRNLADGTGEAGWVELEPLVEAVIVMLAGWDPPGTLGSLRLAKGELISINRGTITYQLDFAVADQLRIVR
ncbi:phage tail terminator protein [Sphingomonas sp.]|uniref:phage tail terminator protein n=1 Tax=Sphingomonas sp. TaxID=28214 RepID=UPI003CC591E5